MSNFPVLTNLCLQFVMTSTEFTLSFVGFFHSPKSLIDVFGVQIFYQVDFNGFISLLWGGKMRPMFFVILFKIQGVVFYVFFLPWDEPHH